MGIIYFMDYIAKATSLTKEEERIVGNIIIDELFSNPDGVELGGNLGLIRILGFKKPYGAKDRYRSQQHKKFIRQLNAHTDFYKYLICLTHQYKGFQRIRNLKFSNGLHVEPTNSVKVRLSKEIEEDPYKFNRVKI